MENSKWYPASDPPKEEGEYLTFSKWGYITVLPYADGWNCRRIDSEVVSHAHENHDIIFWSYVHPPKGWLEIVPGMFREA